MRDVLKISKFCRQVKLLTMSRSIAISTAITVNLFGLTSAANPVDCGFRSLALNVASRSLAGDETKMTQVFEGILATECDRLHHL